MADYITRIRTAEGDKQYDYNSLANKPASLTDVTNTVISPNADYAEVGEWADGNTGKENRLGYFVAIAEVGDNTTKIRKATSHDDVRGVTVYNPAFSGNASKAKYGADGELLPQYNYVGIMGIIPVIDNGLCSVNGRCMPADDGTAVPSTNNMGYAVLERVDATHVLIAVEPAADMVQRIKTDIKALERQIAGGGSGEGGGSALPSVTEADNGKIMQVVDGTWQAANGAALDESTLQNAVNEALAQAKASGEFDGADGKDGKDGADGYTPVKGVDYFDGKDGKDGEDYVLTDQDKADIAALVLADMPSYTGEVEVV